MGLAMNKLIFEVYNPSRKKNELSLARLFPEREHRCFSLARYALQAAFKDAGFVAGQVVLFPSFICRDLLASANTLDLQIKYYDVDENLKPVLPPEKWPKARAVIAVNYFGFPQCLDKFRTYCNINNAILIEDNAHGLFSKDDEGIYLGLRGDYGIFSLRKTIPCPNGGLLVAKKFQSELEIYEPIEIASCKNFIRPLTSFITPFGWQFLTGILRKIRLWTKGEAIARGSLEDEKVIPGSISPCNLDEYLGYVDLDRESERRRELFLLLDKELARFDIQTVYKSLPNSVVPYSYPFYCGENEIAKVKGHLKKLNLECFLWPELPYGIRRKAFYHKLYLVRFLW